MTEAILSSIIELLIISPIIFLFIDKNTNNKWSLIILFYLFYIINQCLTTLPTSFPFFDFIHGNWNWSGKIYATISSIIFYFVFKKHFCKNDFTTLKQQKGSLKYSILVIISLVFLVVISTYVFTPTTSLNYETLAFQLTMPGIDEEFAFRGIMLGILTTLLAKKIIIKNINIGSPATWITAILFGLIHGLALNSNLAIQMNWLSFINTFGIGLLYGWITLKSKSFLMSTLSHNSYNFLLSLTQMIK